MTARRLRAVIGVDDLRIGYPAIASGGQPARTVRRIAAPGISLRPAEPDPDASAADPAPPQAARRGERSGAGRPDLLAQEYAPVFRKIDALCVLSQVRIGNGCVLTALSEGTPTEIFLRRVKHALHRSLVLRLRRLQVRIAGRRESAVYRLRPRAVGRASSNDCSTPSQNRRYHFPAARGRTGKAPCPKSRPIPSSTTAG